MNTDYQIYKILDGATELIRNGWHQGGLMSHCHNGIAYCARGAIIASGTRLGFGSHMLAKAEAALHNVVRNRDNFPLEVSIPSWNDSPCRTHDEVINAFELASAYARQRAEMAPEPEPRKVTFEEVIANAKPSWWQFIAKHRLAKLEALVAVMDDPCELLKLQEEMCDITDKKYSN